MRPYDRDYFMSCFSILMHERRSIINILDDMAMRIEEMEMEFALMCDQQESESIDSLLSEAIEEVLTWDENDDVIYDSSRKTKYCTCDACWSEGDLSDYVMD